LADNIHFRPFLAGCLVFPTSVVEFPFNQHWTTFFEPLVKTFSLFAEKGDVKKMNLVTVTTLTIRDPIVDG